MSDANGRFVLLGVPPGAYVLKTTNRFLGRAVREGRPAHWISQRLAVGTTDLSDLVVELRPGLRIEGRVEFPSATGAQTLGPTSLTRPFIDFETPFGEPGQFAAEATNVAGAFAGVAAGGRYIVRPPEAGGWFVQSITVDGKDITDRAFDLQSDTTSFVVTYTDRPSRVSGTVRDARGGVSANAAALAFPVDPRRW